MKSLLDIIFRQEHLQRSAAQLSEIAFLKEQLAAGDYKIIKCMECSLAGKEPPYDAVSLHVERQDIRDRINALEDEIAANESGSQE